MTGGQRPAELLRRYSVDDLAIFTDPEKLRFLDSGPPDPQVNAKLAWQLLYRLEPGLYERLARAEQVHPSVLDWLPARVERIVEVGAGTGRLTTELATRCDELIAVEPAAPMRWILSTKLHALGAGSHWHVIDGLFDSLPLPDRWASLVVACSSLTETIAQGGGRRIVGDGENLQPRRPSRHCLARPPRVASSARLSPSKVAKLFRPALSDPGRGRSGRERLLPGSRRRGAQAGRMRRPLLSPGRSCAA